MMTQNLRGTAIPDLLKQVDTAITELAAGDGENGALASRRFADNTKNRARPNVGVKKLEGDAAENPISFTNTEGTFMTVLGYRL